MTTYKSKLVLSLILVSCVEPGSAISTDELGNVATPPISTSIAAGDGHTCSIAASGQVYCWGGNAFGQTSAELSVETVTSPRLVAGLPANATKLALGNDHSCALLTNGQVWCWGANTDGQLGDGSARTSHLPVRVVSVSGATAIAAGGAFSCAISSGAVRCWGSNRTRIVGPPLNPNQNILNPRPRVIPGAPTSLSSVVAGLDHACVLTRTGEVWCWGDSSHGESGAIGRNLAPRRVPGIPSAASIAAGHDRTCATTATGDVWCWGSTGHRLYYQGTECPPVANAVPDVRFDLPNQIPPARFAALGETITSIDLGRNHGCLATATRTLCWGYDESGQLGQGTDTRRRTTFNISPGWPWQIRMADITALRPVEGLTSSTVVTTGTAHSCAINAAGVATCWGFNHTAQLGLGLSPVNGARTGAPGAYSPGRVAGLHGVRQLITSGEEVAYCAIDHEGRVVCWGNPDTSDSRTLSRWDSLPRTLEELGRDNVAIRFARVGSPARENICGQRASGEWNCVTSTNGHPPDLITTHTFTGHVSGQSDDCAIAPGGAVECNSGRFVLANPVAQLSASGRNFCARTVNGQVFCNQSGSWFATLNVSGVEDIFAAPHGGCVRQSDGEVRCFAQENSNPTRFGVAAFPAGFTNPSLLYSLQFEAYHSTAFSGRARQISFGRDTTCFVDNVGQVFCTGDNRHGIAGNGNNGALDLANLIPVGLSDRATNVVLNHHTNSACSLTDRGHVYCWGEGGSGELGNGYPFVASPQTLRPAADTSVEQAACGTSFCGVAEVCSPTLRCECAPGYHRCGEVCVSSFSTDHCGTACSPCSAGETNACDGTQCSVVVCANGTQTSDQLTCQTQPSCADANVCGAGSTCIDAPSGPRCVCPTGYTGAGCNTPTTQWTNQHTLVASPNAGSPTSVVVSADGNTLAIGDPNYYGSGNLEFGRVVVLVKRGAEWVHQASIEGTEWGGRNGFGNQVALSADGNTLAVTHHGYYDGKVHIYTRQNGEWSAPNRVEDPFNRVQIWQYSSFGRSIALSEDGQVLAVGAPGNNSGDALGSTGGQVIFYRHAHGATNTESDWQVIDRIVAPRNSNFGTQVACSADCSTVAVSVPGLGVVRVYERNQGAPRMIAELPGASTGFGATLSLSRDGQNLLVGAPDDGIGGAVFLFRRGSDWSGTRIAEGALGSGDRFGTTAVWSPDSQSFAIGAPGDDSSALGTNPGSDNNQIDSGAIYLFGQGGNLLQRFKATDRNAHAFGQAVSFGTDGNEIICPSQRYSSAPGTVTYIFQSR